MAYICLKLIFLGSSVYYVVGHFDILHLQAPQNLFKTALEAGAIHRPAGPGTSPPWRLTTIPWPAKSPDLSCMDFWFWGVAMEEVRKSRPATLNELKAVVEAFAESVDQEEVERGTRAPGSVPGPAGRWMAPALRAVLKRF